MAMKDFDAVVIGGGLFGCYAALLLANKGQHVALLEKESKLLQKASLVNQGRIHGGYHYPRSVDTARQADEYKARFLHDHEDFINFKFDKFYGIDRDHSLVTAHEFEYFCKQLNLKCLPVDVDRRFNKTAFSGFYKTEEYAINPSQLVAHYASLVKSHPRIQIYCQINISHAEESSFLWKILAKSLKDEELIHFQTPLVVNATYTTINTINEIFHTEPLDLTHELSEIVVAQSRPIQDIGLTVIDGPFVSFMPFGKHELISLSSVIHTHHKRSDDGLPIFDCQKDPLYCRPTAPGLCTPCKQRPATHALKMIHQLRTYLDVDVPIEIQSTQFTIKTKLKESAPDDSRPTLINIHKKNPAFVSVFSGKISSIYELEKHFEDII
jgi:hypothetical protein